MSSNCLSSPQIWRDKESRTFSGCYRRRGGGSLERLRWLWCGVVTVKMSNLSWRMICWTSFRYFWPLSLMQYYFPSSPVGVHRRRVRKHKPIFVHGLIFLLQQYRLRPDHAFEVVKSGVFVVENPGVGRSSAWQSLQAHAPIRSVRLHPRSTNSSHPVMCQNCSFRIAIAYAVNTYRHSLPRFCVG